eukprot:TRINITY_DN4579_c0_g1_i1.p1 TRINITY_DN4579_c0_g1~~TRINITY_DN4579_c0_g1_i1.p1  ORF type:complete len:262 (-),score=35.35 TRINITY_DN4579_c0_g1_i1:144-869(-)
MEEFEDETPTVVELSKVPKWTSQAFFYKKYPQLTLINRVGKDHPDLKGCEGLDKEDLTPKYPFSQELNDKVSLWDGDITMLSIDAIVNAANFMLSGGEGVDSCIHIRAGDELRDACEEIGGCEPGQAIITPGFKLPSKHIIHTVATHTEDAQILKNCYENSLNKLVEHNLRVIAFPCIATGHCNFPLIPATHVALAAVREWLEKNQSKVDRVIFVTFKLRHQAVYEQLMPVYFPPSSSSNN